MYALKFYTGASIYSRGYYTKHYYLLNEVVFCICIFCYNKGTKDNVHWEHFEK